MAKSTTVVPEPSSPPTRAKVKERVISPLHGPITQNFLDQCKQFKLYFQCEDCALFNEETEECVHFYPNAPHRRHYFEGDPVGKVLIFCRDFEMSEDL